MIGARWLEIVTTLGGGQYGGGLESPNNDLNCDTLQLISPCLALLTGDESLLSYCEGSSSDSTCFSVGGRDLER